MDEAKRAWAIFKASFAADTAEQPIYMATRSNMGTYLAVGAALYNLYLIRQQVLKNSIWVTRSNNPRVIKPMCLVIGSLYFAAFYVIWHVPLFFSEVATRVYVSAQDATTNYLLNKHLHDLLFCEKRVRMILQDEGLRI